MTLDVEDSRSTILFDGKASDVCWSPDGQSVGFTHWEFGTEFDYLYRLMDEASKTIYQKIPIDRLGFLKAEWSPNNRFIAFGYNNQLDERIYLVYLDLQTQVCLLFTADEFDLIGFQSWNKDGSAVGFTARKRGENYNSVWLMDWPAGLTSR